ncbi:MAG: protein kinase [Myxococcales bacterium]|nr:protein kinase [Myxococcales bacterium]
MRPELDDTATAAPAAGGTAAREPGAIAIGMQLGHFRIERRLGAGGMGEVYLATDLALDRPVAIKVLPAQVAGDPGRRDRMVREARAQAKISHPNVGHIYFIGEHEQLLYFAMEYVAGETLADRVAKAPLSVDAALAVTRAAALGLREAHRSGFTHRDVKPSNLMIDGHGVVKVLDFGLAAGDPHAATDGPVAQTSMAGTPLYMAPEQARGEPIDFRADIYALGATLYHLVSGAPPYQADSVEGLLSLHATAARPALPTKKGRTRTESAAIDALCARMMAPAPADRFASYDELLRALELASATHTRPAGFWARAIAGGVDVLVAGTVVSAALLLGEVLTGYELDSNFVPIIALFAVYGLVCTARWGTTLGKALFELEVVEVATGVRPSWRVAVKRTALVFTVPLALGLFTLIARHVDLGPKLVRDLTGGLTGLWFPICGLVLVHAALRVPGKRAPWDRLAGTVVRYRRGDATGL